MKRLLAVLMMVLLLAGCGQTEKPADEVSGDALQAVLPAPEERETLSEQRVPLESMPELETQSESESVVKPTPTPESETEPEPKKEPEIDWGAAAAQVYTAITDQKEFSVQVEEIDGTLTDFTIREGENDWNADGLEYSFAGYTWTPATLEDWHALTASEERGTKLTFSVPEELSLVCFEGGDIVELVREGTVSYVRAVNPKEGQEPFEGKLYHLLDMIAEDAMSEQVWSVAVDASLSAEDAAKQLTEKIVEAYHAVPDWVTWKPVDVRMVGAEVYDIYRGTPEQFCFHMGIEVSLKDPMAPEAIYWQAGAGLAEPNEAGFSGWGRQVLVEKTADGLWMPVEWGTGGYMVLPRMNWKTASVEQLVEGFCLTEGQTHDWLAAYYLLELPVEEMTRLPAILDQLTEGEIRDLCGTLGKCLREYDYWNWTVDTLRPVLGKYGGYLGA